MTGDAEPVDPAYWLGHDDLDGALVVHLGPDAATAWEMGRPLHRSVTPLYEHPAAASGPAGHMSVDAVAWLGATNKALLEWQETGVHRLAAAAALVEAAEAKAARLEKALCAYGSWDQSWVDYDRGAHARETLADTNREDGEAR